MQEFSNKAWILRLDSFNLALVEPHALATEAFVDTDISKRDLLELHAAFRASHVVQFALALPLLLLHACFALLRELSSQFHLLSSEVFFFGTAGFHDHIVSQSRNKLKNSAYATSYERNQMRIVGLILAVSAVVAILVVAGDQLMLRLFPASFDDQGVSHDARILGARMLWTIFLYCLGGYTVTALSPRPQRVALLFGLFMLAVACLEIWIDYYSSPRWYHIASILSPIPAALIGGRIRGRE